MTTFEQALQVPAEHPAFPGHFPGQPLVPGVVLLEQVALALRAWRGERLARVLEAKFMAPLLPGQSAVVQLTKVEDAPSPVRFEIRRDGMVLARGAVEGTP